MMDRREREALDRHITGGHGFDPDDEPGPETPERPEVEGECYRCGWVQDVHRLESREDTYGREYEGLRCPPEGFENMVHEAQQHWITSGCEDLSIGRIVAGIPWCQSCGADL